MTLFCRFIVVAALFLCWPSRGVAAKSDPFEDGSYLVLDVSRAKTEGAHELYLAQPSGERALLWSYTYIPGPIKRPASMGLNEIKSAWNDGASYTVLISDLSTESMFFLKVEGVVAPRGWFFGIILFPYPPRLLNRSDVKFRLTGSNSFTGQLGNEPPMKFNIAGSGEIFMNGKATGVGAHLINGTVVSPKEAYGGVHTAKKGMNQWTGTGDVGQTPKTLGTAPAGPATKGAEAQMPTGWAILWIGLGLALASVVAWLLLRLSKRKQQRSRGVGND
jgi:hypothetical protein